MDGGSFGGAIELELGIWSVTMPRQKRVDVAGVTYHAINRSNARLTIFHESEDYDAFIRIMVEGLERYQVELFAFTLMPNHWHLVLRPGKPTSLFSNKEPQQVTV